VIARVFCAAHIAIDPGIDEAFRGFRIQEQVIEPET
jgi:hypothetical protein